MSPLRDRRVAVLLVLVLLGSGLSIALALVRPDPDEAGAPPVLPTTTGTTTYVPADLVGPGGEALASLATALPLAFGYDHAALDESLRAARSRMTPRYAREFTRVFDREVRPIARERRAVTRGVVEGAGVVRTRDDTSVVCLVYLDQLLVKAKGLARGQQPEVLGQHRLRVSMVLRDGEWLIDDLSSL